MKPYMLKFLALLFGLLLMNNPMYSQSKVELSGGFGIPELFNIGIKYGKNTQIGANVGFYPFKWYGNNVVDWSCSTVIIHHFAGKSKYVEQPTWYILGSLGYYDLGVMNLYEEFDISFCPRIGKTLNFSRKSGINLDIGLFLPLSATKGYSYDFRLLPSGSISFFIRL